MGASENVKALVTKGAERHLGLLVWAVLSGEVDAPSIDLKGDPSGSLSNLRLAVPVGMVAA